MSDRPTPETDDEKIYRLIVEQADLLSRLGITEIQIDKAIRERDELREERDIARLEFEEISNELNDARKERDELREVLREITAADWKTSGELRCMARRALEGAK